MTVTRGLLILNSRFFAECRVARTMSLWNQRLLSAMAIAPLHADLMARLASPSSVRRFSIAIRMDNGRLRMFIGWRVIYACGQPSDVHSIAL
jgi:hypothetical protein